MSEYIEHMLRMDIMQGALTVDGHDNAIVGYTAVWDKAGAEYVYVYSTQRIVCNLMDNDGMTEEEAWEYFSFNIEGSYMGSRQPLYLFDEKEFTYFDKIDFAFEEDTKQMELPLVDNMWIHHCYEEGTHEVEKGKECNWCGETEEGESSN
tara:strand:- start:160 stop:609 length:450 start_codon:yes stop_codon:yes gene_type:complete